MPIPKAQPRQRSLNRARGKTRVFTDTPERNEIEEQLKKKNNQNHQGLRQKLKPSPSSLTNQKKRHTSSSSSEEDIGLSYDNDSDIEIDEKIEPNLDYVVLLVDGKSRSLKYIARVDNYDDEDDDYEGVFLQKINSRVDSGQPIFIVMTTNLYSSAHSH